MKEDTGSEMEEEEDTGSMLGVRTKRRDKRSIGGAMSKANKVDYVYTLAETSMMMPKVVAILDGKKSYTTWSSTSHWLL